MCGPTVYDSAHLGHARTYVCFDILSRILSEVFGCRLTLAMNITDIDDKIIARATENGEDWEALARRFEEEFFADMASLQVRQPTVVTRVSEHIDEVVQMIEQIMNRGAAYEAEDGVYFDTAAHPTYGRLAPAAASESRNVDVPEEEDGPVAGKRDARDFALWKRAKAGEPAWESPWGSGRPGWHIECSAMCSSIFGRDLDFHTGGVDLRFPHHCNEIAQCEAAHGTEDWPRHFAHTGHLYIAGRKMSKSLKNFITIRELLQSHTADHFRLFCLAHKYSSNIDYADDRMREAVASQRRFEEFFRQVHAHCNVPSAPAFRAWKWTFQDTELEEQLASAHQQVRHSLAQDFDTPAALQHLGELVTAANVAMRRDDHPAAPHLVQDIAQFVAGTLDVFGLQFPRVSLSAASASSAEGAGGPPSSACIDTLLAFRSEVRQTCRTESPDSIKARVLAQCDAVRDVALPALGIRLKDRADGTTLWHLDSSPQGSPAAPPSSTPTPSTSRISHAEHLSQGTAPQDLYRGQVELYSVFSPDGLPVQDASGQALSNKEMKRLRAKQRKYAALFKAHYGDTT